MIKQFKKLSEEIVYRSKYIAIKKEGFESSNGKQGEYFFITDFSGVDVIGMDNEDNFLLVREYRYPIKQIAINPIAGVIEKGENIVQAVRRELMEEIGHESDEIISLGKVPYAPGKCDGWIHLFIAKNCTPVKNPSHEEETEVTELYKLPINKAWQFIATEKDLAPLTISLIVKALLYLDIKP